MGARRRRSSTSPTTRTPSSGGRSARAGGASSPPSAGSPTTCPTRRTRRRSSARGCDWDEVAAGHPCDAVRLVPRPDRPAAERSPPLTRRPDLRTVAHAIRRRKAANDVRRGAGHARSSTSVHEQILHGPRRRSLKLAATPAIDSSSGSSRRPPRDSAADTVATRSTTKVNGRQIETYSGRPRYPLGATWDGSGVNFAALHRARRGVELCLFDEATGRRDARIRMPRADGHVWHVYLPEARPGQLYGYRVHGPYDPGRATASTRTSCCSTRTPRRSTGTIDWSRRHVRLSRRTAATTATCTMDDRDSAAGMPKARRDRPGVHLGRRPPAAHAVARDDHLRGARQGLHEAPSRRRRRELRGTYAGLGRPPRHRLPAGPRRHRRRAAAGPPLRRRQAPGRQGACATTGATTRIGFFAPDPRYASLAAPGAAGQRVQDDGQDAAPRRHRGHPRRRLQPHRRGQPPRARRSVLPRHRQRSLLPPGRRTTARYYMDYTGTRQHAEHAAPAHAAADHGQPALLGARRCTSTASASTSPPPWRASCTRSTA